MNSIYTIGCTLIIIVSLLPLLLHGVWKPATFILSNHITASLGDEKAGQVVNDQAELQQSDDVQWL